MLHEVMSMAWVSGKAIIGRGVLLGRNTRIWGPARIGDGCIIDDGVQIGYPSPIEQQAARNGLAVITLTSLDCIDEFVQAETVIGERSVIRSHSVIYSGSKIGPDFDCAHYVTIREGCNIGYNTYIKVATELRRDVTVGNDCVLAGTIADRSVLSNGITCLGHLVHKYYTGKRGQIEDAPRLLDRCFVGRRACIIGAVTLDEECYVAAGAIVTFDVPKGALIRSPKGVLIHGGSPLRTPSTEARS
ncbi:MAG: DapH/DapD/GlmU-related protein [Candidatus Aminicenantes bacterium]|nr:DapH/DapD/GlmU-related protein [Candidatus Aminicenantes bacterium]